MAMIADAFASKLIDLFGKLVEGEVDLLLGVPGEIQKLQRTLRTVSNVLADAERRRIQEEVINDWLKELKDVMYDADDILDRWEIEADKNRGVEPSTVSKKRRLGSPLTGFQKTTVTHEIGSRIKGLNERLEEISKRKSQFRLELNSPEAHRNTSPISRQTSPIVDPDIVGSKIEEDTASLVKLLTTQDLRANVLVFGIVGLGGIGKSTLAQKIFNDQRIDDNFQIKKWVCVSQEFSEIELLKKIITTVGGDVPGGAEHRSDLEPIVAEQFREKKFLLVLDDIWAVEVWDGLLRKPLASGAVGSRVLITTRNEGVARQMKAVHCHHVEMLSEEDGWVLLCKQVVLPGDEREIQNLKDIGMEIVRKCGGLPLAIKTIGGVLCMKNKKISDWKGVLNNTAWSVTGLPEQVQAALYLSYEDLPSHLKQCFLYCSLYREDQIIASADLIRRWIAEGFVEVRESSSMQDVGKEYYTELIMRNLLLPHPRWFDNEKCTMHDLLHSLTQFLTQGESTTLGKIKRVNSSPGPMKLRRVFITDEEMAEAPGDLMKQKYVRTLLLDVSRIYDIDNLIDNLPRLRVLSLSYTWITNLPDSLGSLVHLRYLRLSHSKISVIPETIGSLKKLQYLLLTGCRNLVALPNSIVNLRSLRDLCVRETMLDGLPCGLGRLQHLCKLGVIVPPSNSAEGFSNLEELGNLSQLRTLVLQKLERVSGRSEARGAALHDKPELVELWLDCTPQPSEVEHTEEEMKKIEEVFDELSPPSCLETLEMHDYFGRQFPTWMTVGISSSASNVSNLRWLKLQSCSNCERLPPFGLYSNLCYLHIIGAGSVTSIGHEFLQGGGSCDRNAGIYLSTSLFPKLEELVFKDMPNWEEWVWENGMHAMPNLKQLNLKNCPKLRSLPKGLLRHATSLTNLGIVDCDSLGAVENLLSVKALHLERNSNFVRVSNVSALRSLIVKQCPQLQVVENLSALQRMRLEDGNMEAVPEYLSEGIRTAELKKLDISCSTLLFLDICRMDRSPEWPKIKHFHSVSIYTTDGSLYAHYNKTPFSFNTNLNDYLQEHPNSFVTEPLEGTSL